MTNEAAEAFGQRPLMDREQARRLRVIETARLLFVQSARWMTPCGKEYKILDCEDARRVFDMASALESAAEKYLKDGEV